MPRRGDPELAREIATRLKALREARGLSQEALAERAGLVGETVSRTERGTLLPTIATLRSLARGLDVPVGALLDPDPGERVPDLLLTDEEREIVERVRRVPAGARSGLLDLLRVATGR